MKNIIDKLKNFVQRAMDLEGTTAIFQIGNSIKIKKDIMKTKALIEKLGGKVEWYYFDGAISNDDLDFEISVLKPHVNRIVGFGKNDVAVFYVEGDKSGIK
jgi:hypothetical protein